MLNYCLLLFLPLLSASMCRTLLSPCSSAQSRKKETQPLHTVSKIVGTIKLFSKYASCQQQQAITSCMTKLLPCFPSIRDNGWGSRHYSWYGHPGTDCWYGEPSLHPRTWWSGGRPEQLFKLFRNECLWIRHFHWAHGKLMYSLVIVWASTQIVTALLCEDEPNSCDSSISCSSFLTESDFYDFFWCYLRDLCPLFCYSLLWCEGAKRWVINF